MLQKYCDLNNKVTYYNINMNKIKQNTMHSWYKRSLHLAVYFSTGEKQHHVQSCDRPAKYVRGVLAQTLKKVLKTFESDADTHVLY